MRPLDHSHMFDLIESKRWICDDGRTASPYGSAPWVSDADRARWQLQIVGWTVRHKKTGTIGIGRAPWTTREAAENWLYGRNLGQQPLDL